MEENCTMLSADVVVRGAAYDDGTETFVVVFVIICTFAICILECRFTSTYTMLLLRDGLSFGEYCTAIGINADDMCSEYNYVALC